MLLRKFNDDGLIAMSHVLRELQTGKSVDFSSLLQDANRTITLPVEIELDADRTFSSRLEACEYLAEKLVPLKIKNIERDTGIWSWLALFYFRELSGERFGKITIKDQARWILAANDFQRYYRHLLAGPFATYKTYHEIQNLRAVDVILCQRIDKPGEMVEQLSAYQEIIQNPTIMAAATHLYYSSERNALKRGAQGKSGGSVRRFVAVLNQLQLTIDLFSLSYEEILALLPQEFDKFKKL